MGIWAIFEHGKLVSVGDKHGAHSIPRRWIDTLKESEK
jgi:hypothetical protein